MFDMETTTIQCKDNENLEELFKKFCKKIGKNYNEIFFLYGSHIIEVKEKTFNDVANTDDKKRKKMSILVIYNKTTIIQDKVEKKSKYIICPKCSDSIRINIKDFKIKLFECKNNHIFENLSFSNFNDSQVIDYSKINCDICKTVNRSKTFNNSFFICNSCNINICPLCNQSHDKNHHTIEYDDKYFKCCFHNQSFTNFCNDCHQNLCILCENDHSNHNKISLGSMIPKENNFKENQTYLRIMIDKFKKKIQEIIDKFNNVISNIELYYNIYSDIISSYNSSKINYQTLKNLNDVNIYNNEVIKELINILPQDECLAVKNVMNIFNQINYNIKFNSDISDKLHMNEDKNEIQNDNTKLNNKNIEDTLGESLFQERKYSVGNYIGEFKNNKRDGKGKMNLNNGNVYEGDFKNGKYEGKGIFIFKNGDRYQGDFKNDKFEGKGKFYYNNGDKYDGDWKKDKKDGKGIFYYANGSRYEGDWKNDNKEGNGIYYYNYGDREMGDYVNGNKVGKHVTLDIKYNVITKIYN